MAAPQKYDYDYDLNDVLEQYLGTQTTKSFEIESITTRTNDVLVFGTETNTVNGIDYPAKYFLYGKMNKMVGDYCANILN
ncbi:hypothetical protein [Piscibacillus salipiscarius]|uniref:hypothetical protein n=1 Tax=Piscibacillus salipiscarius TaxID=299480 RepID=UPI002436AFA1|nr:hypothetical protein [Piscibacillus salipiscarius]